MTEKEIEEFVKQLPWLNKGECYIIHREEGPYRFEYLLPNGELVIASNSVTINWPIGAAHKEDSKQTLKDCLKNHKYIGIGMYHRHVRSI
jgi:hypothetical protein